MKEALVIVDAWEKILRSDERHASLQDTINDFSHFLNRVALLESARGTTVIQCSNRPISSIFDYRNVQVIVKSGAEIPTGFDAYYFGGFHFGRCISRAVKACPFKDKGIVLNLSMVFTEDTWHDHLKSCAVPLYLWADRGFEPIAFR